MKALSKEQDQKKIDLVDAIRTAHDELETAITEYNAAMEEEQDKVQGKLNALNEKIREASDWATGIASEMQSYYDEKSERWQEGENGENYLSWKEEYEGLSTDDVEIDFPEDMEVPVCDVADDLESLPDEP